MLTNGFARIDEKLFFTRNDADDPRLGELAKPLADIATAADLAARLKSEIAGAPVWVLAGYPDDHGIQINGGRLGAALAPDEIRRPLYKMTPSLSATLPIQTKLFDLGNLQCGDRNLADRHQTASEHARAALTSGARWIGIGGGHDYGYPDAAAFCQWAKEHARQRPLVINFDAHLDVRPIDKGLSSGTPFFRMLEAFPQTDFLEIGIQNHCNSQKHLAWAHARGVRVLTMEEVEASGHSLLHEVRHRLDDWIKPGRPVFISVDIDGFSSADAPGCSQSWATGFAPRDFFMVLSWLLQAFDVRMLGIYEVSPPLDHDARTAKLAAQIIHRALMHENGENS